jgi:hypothetical protein
LRCSKTQGCGAVVRNTAETVFRTRNNSFMPTGHLEDAAIIVCEDILRDIVGDMDYQKLHLHFYASAVRESKEKAKQKQNTICMK